jgi:surface protein
MAEYKAYIKNNYFYLERLCPKEVFVSFLKDVQIDPSNTGDSTYRIHNLKDWDYKVPIKIEQLLKEDESPYTLAEWQDFYSANTGNFGGGGGEDAILEVLEAIKEEIILIKEEALNDDSYQLFEDTDGNVLFGKIDDEGVMKYYKPDGSEYTGDVKPYSRETQQSITDYCADSVPYTLIQLRDADKKEVVASIWRNDNDLTESNTAPANVTKGVCVVEDLIGKSCDTPIYSNICNTADITDPINAKLQELIDANNLSSQQEQAILTTIKEKIEALTVVIEAFKAENNTNSLDIIAKLQLQLDKLIALEALITTGNATLVEIKDKLAEVNTSLSTIKDTIIEFKDLFELKIDLVLDTLDSIITELGEIKTLLQTEFDQTQNILNAVKDAIELKGSDCKNTVFTTDCDRQALLDKLDELIDATEAGNIDYTALLTSIDTKASNLATIVTELQTANTTLTGIKTDTTATNTKLDSLITKATEQLDELVLIKEKIDAGNLSLAELVTLTTNIDVNITTIKNDVALIKADISEIKADVKLAVTALNNIETLIEASNDLLADILAELDVELVYTSATQLNNGTDNFYSREKILWDSETSAEISRVTEFSTDGKTWNTTVPTGTLEIGWINTAFILGQEFLNCGVKTDGTKSEWFIRQDYLGTEELPLKYSQDKIIWTEAAPTDTTFELGACTVEAVTPVCIENVSYDLDGATGIVFEASKLNSYNAFVYKGEMKYTEKNSVGFVEETYEHSNGFNQDDRLLPNELKIVNKDGNSRTIIKVLQVCGYMPIIADVINENMVLLVSATPKADNTAIDVKFTDVQNAIGYRIKRYVKGQPLTTALTLLDWTEGVANPLITNNGDGTYTYKDATAVVGTDYMYFYEAYNAISEGTSNELEASLFAISFEPVMRTTLPNEMVTLPMTVTSPVTIEWGDGTTTTQSAPFTKVYAVTGDYHIKVKITASREVTNFRFNNAGDRLKLIDIKNWGWVKLGTLGSNFFGCANLEKITAEDTPSGLINMANFFRGCSKLNQIDNFNWDTSFVTNMSFLFSGCTIFNLPVSQLNTSSVTNMSVMFASASAFNQSVSSFDTSLVTNMSSMFFQASAFNQSVSNFDTSKVTSMQAMFQLAIVFNQSVSNFDTSKVTDMFAMFNNAKAFNQPVPFSTPLVTTMNSMFSQASLFNQPINFNIPLVNNLGNFVVGSAFSTTNMDKVLIHFANQTTQNNVPMNNNRPRTIASNAAVATLQSRGWTGLV